MQLQTPQWLLEIWYASNIIAGLISFLLYYSKLLIQMSLSQKCKPVKKVTMSWIDLGLVDKVTEVMNFSTKVQKWVVKSCSQPPGQLAWARQQMWLRSGPEPVPALDQSEAEIPRQLGSRPMRGQVRDVRSINGSVRAVRGGGSWDHNIASWGRPSPEDPGVLPTNTCSEKYKGSQKY